MSEKQKTGEPSMDDILASIRRIIADDNADGPLDAPGKKPHPGRPTPPVFGEAPSHPSTREGPARPSASDPFAEQLATTLERPIERRFAPVRDELMDLLVDRETGRDKLTPPPPPSAPARMRTDNAPLPTPTSHVGRPSGAPPEPLPLSRGDATSKTSGVTPPPPITSAEPDNTPAHSPTTFHASPGDSVRSSIAEGKTTAPAPMRDPSTSPSPSDDKMRPAVGFIPTAASIAPPATADKGNTVDDDKHVASKAAGSSSVGRGDEPADQTTANPSLSDISERTASRPLRSDHTPSGLSAQPSAFPLPPSRPADGAALAGRSADNIPSQDRDKKSALLAEADIAKQARSALEKLAKGLATMTGSAPAVRPTFELPPTDGADRQNRDTAIGAAIGPEATMPELSVPISVPDTASTAAIATGEGTTAELAADPSGTSPPPSAEGPTSATAWNDGVIAKTSAPETADETDSTQGEEQPAAQAVVASSGDAREPAPPLENAPRTLEDTVVDMLRPMLRSWLDEHLPSLVTKALEKELAARDDVLVGAEAGTAGSIPDKA